MEQTEMKEQVATPARADDDPSGTISPAAAVVSGAGAQQCGTWGTMPPSNARAPGPPAHVYAIGRIKPRFPRPSVEKEFAQALGRDKAAGLTDRQVVHAALSKPGNRHLARQLCWVMTIEGLETYILVPRDPVDVNLLVDALRPTPRPRNLDCVIGLRGPIAPPEMCNGFMVPIVVFDQIYSFDRDSLIKAIPKPEKITAKEFAPAGKELFDRIMQMADNAGAADEHRALNYLAVRYPRIYEAVAEAFGRNESLTAVLVVASPLSGTRKVVEVVFSYTNRNSDVVEKFCTRVDITDEFPFLVTKLSPYYARSPMERKLM
jgi:cyclic patellamide precursor peptide PatG